MLKSTSWDKWEFYYKIYCNSDIYLLLISQKQISNNIWIVSLSETGHLFVYNVPSFHNHNGL